MPKSPPSAAKKRRELETSRTDLEEEYKIAGNGIVRDPGKYEGQPIFVAHYWEAEVSDEEFEDEFGRDVAVIFPEEIDRQVFPELGQDVEHGAFVAALWIWETESGLILGRAFTTEAEEKSARDEIEQAVDDDGDPDEDSEEEETPDEDAEPDLDADDENDDKPPTGSLSGTRGATLAKVKAAAKKIGAEVEVIDNTLRESSGGLDFNIVAPSRKMWASNSLHDMNFAIEYPEFERKEALLAGALKEIAEGLVACDVKDCERCSEE